MPPHPITPAAMLLPVLVRVVSERLGAKACKRRGIGAVRHLLRTDPKCQASENAEQILAALCAKCGRCRWGHK